MIDDETVFELNQEINRLRGQVTYLQEQLAIAEDEIERLISDNNLAVQSLERQLGDALYGVDRE